MEVRSFPWFITDFEYTQNLGNMGIEPGKSYPFIGYSGERPIIFVNGIEKEIGPGFCEIFYK